MSIAQIHGALSIIGGGGRSGFPQIALTHTGSRTTSRRDYKAIQFSWPAQGQYMKVGDISGPDKPLNSNPVVSRFPIFWKPIPNL